MKIGVLTTGGTIATTRTSDTGEARPRLEGRALVGDLRLPSTVKIVTEAISLAPSTHITLPDMWRLSRRVDALLTSQEVDAIVVTHGTDTIEETAFFLATVLPDNCPLVLTGAMRLASEPGADGPANLRAAVLTAVTMAHNEGFVAIVMNDEVHAAEYVTKLHTTSTGAFTSAPFGPLGIIYENRVMMPFALRERRKPNALSRWVEADFEPRFPDVELFKAVAGGTAGPLAGAIARRPYGIVIEGTGGGHVPPAYVPAIQEAIDNGVLVAVVSRCPVGYPLRETYTIEGGECHLRELGAVTVRLSGVKARLLVSIAGAVYPDIASVRELLEDY